MAAGRLSILIRLAWQLFRLKFSRASDKQQRSNRLLFDNFLYLGGVYAKFLQNLAVSVDFLRGWAGPAEFEVFEAVAYEQIDLLATLAQEIPDYQLRFRSIDQQPFAAGSFAQVYRAELANGSSVVIKVLRPSLSQYLKSDLRLLGWIARLSGWLYPNSMVSVGRLYNQFAAMVLGETDYQREVRNAQWFHEYFKGQPEIVIPHTYAELSGSKLLVQEYVAGLSLADVLIAQKSGQQPADIVWERLGSDIWRQLEVLGTALLTATVLADFVLGDPHPGNIRLLPDNKIGLIDFGIAAPAPRNRTAFFGLIREYQKLYHDAFDGGSFTLAALRYFDEDLVDALKMAGRLYAPTRPDSLLETVAASAKQALADNYETSAATQTFMQRRMMIQLFTSSINERNRFGITMNIEAAVMFKSATTYLKMVGSVGQHGKNFVVIQRAIDATVAAIEANGIESQASRTPLSPERSLELISSWLARVADTDPFLYRQIAGNMAL